MGLGRGAARGAGAGAVTRDERVDTATEGAVVTAGCGAAAAATTDAGEAVSCVGSWLSLGTLSVTEIGALDVALERPDDQVLACGLDDFFRDQSQFVNLEDALDLREQALDQSKVTTRDARDRGYGLDVREVVRRQR